MLGKGDEMVVSVLGCWRWGWIRWGRRDGGIYIGWNDVGDRAVNLAGRKW